MPADIDAPIPVEVWEKGEDGFLHYVKSRTIGEIGADLARHLKKEGLEEEGVSRLVDKETPFPKKWRWIACFAVTGSNEGHYVHVEVFEDGVDMKGKHTAILLFLVKTFNGLERAQQIAAACARLLGA
jgi:hypothetical protein